MLKHFKNKTGWLNSYLRDYIKVGGKSEGDWTLSQQTFSSEVWAIKEYDDGKWNRGGRKWAKSDKSVTIVEGAHKNLSFTNFIATQVKNVKLQNKRSSCQETFFALQSRNSSKSLSSLLPEFSTWACLWTAPCRETLSCLAFCLSRKASARRK